MHSQDQETAKSTTYKENDLLSGIHMISSAVSVTL
jgi:hypothetical protein